MLQLTLAGFGVFEERDQGPQVLSRGDVFVVPLPSATTYATRQGCDWRFAYLYITGDLVRFHVERLIEQRGHVFHIDDAHPFSDALQRTLQAVFDAVHDASLLSGLLYQCLMQACPRLAGSGRQQQLQQVHAYIDAHLADPALNVAEMAAAAGKSQYHFSRQFKTAYGVSPWQYVIRLRVQQALDLLNSSDLSNAAIAERCGFNDSPHFNHAFKRHVGCSPGQYRRRMQWQS